MVARRVPAHRRSTQTGSGPITEANAEIASPTATVTLAHLSDLHLSDPSGAPWAVMRSPKRFLAYLSWRVKKRRRHDADVLAAAVADLDQVAPDAVAITGDLTHLGLPREYRQVRDWLPLLGDASRVALVPGNHDASRAEAWHDGLGTWSEWLTSDGGETPRDETTAFPSHRRHDPVELIGVSTACQSSAFMATGFIGTGQLERLERRLEESREAGCFRVVFMHHPPRHGVVGWRKRLTDLDELLAVLDRQGVELLLHGHAHRPEKGTVRLAGSDVVVIGSPATNESIPGHRRGGLYHVFEVGRSQGAFDVAMTRRRFNPTTGCFEAIDSEAWRITR